MLGLVVVLIELRGVLLGGDGSVEGDLDLPHLRIVEVHGGQPGLTPVDPVQMNAPHGKTADDLPQTGELPVITLEKEIPATDLHDM